MIYYVTTSNRWRPVSYYVWTAVNLLNAMWVAAWSQGTKTSLVICLVVIVLLVISILSLWYTTYESSGSGEKDLKYYLMRNTIAFYLGWVVGATFLNLGIVLVHVYGMTQKEYSAIFWIAVPITGIAVTVLNYIKQGMNGLKSSIGAWLSILWAMAGAAIQSAF